MMMDGWHGVVVNMMLWLTWWWKCWSSNCPELGSFPTKCPLIFAYICYILLRSLACLKELNERSMLTWVTTKYWRHSCAAGLSSSYHLQCAPVLYAYHLQVLCLLSSLRHCRDIVPPLSKGPNHCQNPTSEECSWFHQKSVVSLQVCKECLVAA